MPRVLVIFALIRSEAITVEFPAGLEHDGLGDPCRHCVLAVAATDPAGTLMTTRPSLGRGYVFVLETTWRPDNDGLVAEIVRTTLPDVDEDSSFEMDVP